MTDNRENDTLKGITDKIKAHPGAAVAGGVVLGMLVSALLPRGSARKLARGAVAAATVGSEAGMLLARQARDTAASAASEASERLSHLEEKAGEGAKALGRKAIAASDDARGAGLGLARTVVRLLESLRP
ncbi:MAG: hypothetical protein ABIM50_11340 [Novosphingobium sp.]